MTQYLYPVLLEVGFLFKGKNRYVSIRYIEEVELPKVVEEVADTTVKNVVEVVEEVPVVEAVLPTNSYNENRFVNRFFGTRDGDLHLIADIWGGYSNFKWDNGSPNMHNVIIDSCGTKSQKDYLENSQLDMHGEVVQLFRFIILDLEFFPLLTDNHYQTN